MGIHDLFEAQQPTSFFTSLIIGQQRFSLSPFLVTALFPAESLFQMGVVREGVARGW
jgi:hypothetical protein